MSFSQNGVKSQIKSGNNSGKSSNICKLSSLWIKEIKEEITMFSTKTPYQTKRCLLFGRKAMTNLDSILKSRHVTFPTKVHLVKAMAFPVVMYGCESWTIKKAECQRIDAFELWCWRRLFLSFFFLILLFLLFFYFFYLWWILSYIEMKQPGVYMCSPSRSPLLPPSPPAPSRFSQCTRSERLSHASNLGW